jgi:hypothetical protein
MGNFAAERNQRSNAIAIGHEAGRHSQGMTAIAIGYLAGQASDSTNGQAPGAIAIGFQAGRTHQGISTVAVGTEAGETHQARNAISIGEKSGMSNQGVAAIAIGYQAGTLTQGTNAIAIGANSGTANQATQSIIINATGGPLQNTTAGTCKIAPIAEGYNPNVLTYNTTTSEVNYTPGLGAINSISATDGGDFDLFDDGVVRIWLDDSTTDDIELEITNSFAPTGSVYHVSWTNIQSPSGTPGSVSNMVDLNASGTTSNTTLDFNFATDEIMTLRIWSPALGTSWGFYEATIIKSSNLYTGSPVLCSVKKSY